MRSLFKGFASSTIKAGIGNAVSCFNSQEVPNNNIIVNTPLSIFV